MDHGVMRVQDEPDRTVIDGLFFYSDGHAEEALAGGIHAINLTVVHPLAGLTQAFDEIAEWTRRVRMPDSRWHLVRTTKDIIDAKAKGRLGLIMGWQNMLPIEDRIDRIALFQQLGVRIMQLTYNAANFIGDGCLERRDAGLTEFGRQVVSEMNAVGVAIDLSHCGEKVALDAAGITTKPLLLTHANANAVFARPRNKSDKVIRAVAQTGGVIGLSTHGFMNWTGNPAQPPSLEGFVANVKHVRNLVGIDHIGIGTDHAVLGEPGAADGFLKMSKEKFAGASGDFVAAFGNKLESRFPQEIPTPREYQQILQALSQHGLTSGEIDKIAGGNFLRAFRDIWGA
jgi:membrane dipeptidase